MHARVTIIYIIITVIYISFIMLFALKSLLLTILIFIPNDNFKKVSSLSFITYYFVKAFLCFILKILIDQDCIDTISLF